MNWQPTLCIVCCTLAINCVQVSQTKLANPVPIIVVKDTTHYGRDLRIDNSVALIAKRKPANVTGLKEFSPLRGRCFSHTSGKYRYDLCPFENATQHELGVSWRPFQGVLGIWSGNWIIENNTFVAMLYTNGDNCGDKERSVRVAIVCGQNEALTDVQEFATCEYQFRFATAYACHRQALLVYPRLDVHLRQKWDLIETKLSIDLITKKGYDKQVNDLFVEAGLYPKPALKNEIRAEKTRGFTNVSQCVDAYIKLEDELKICKTVSRQNLLNGRLNN